MQARDVDLGPARRMFGGLPAVSVATPERRPRPGAKISMEIRPFITTYR